uniref:Uncharacterized protein n=1 Tax=Rhizophora mucronata TaxID=61149 RepID=A0A2P2PGN1_RHIMU
MLIKQAFIKFQSPICACVTKYYQVKDSKGQENCSQQSTK